MANLLKDIALKAHVTSGTVSRALSGKSGVSEAKRKKILKLAEEMHYVPIPRPAISEQGNAKDS